MTIIIAFLLGGGILLLISAIEDKPIVATFQQILRGEKLDLSGKGTSAPSGTTPAPDKPLPIV
jgi:hypothetical protein